MKKQKKISLVRCCYLSRVYIVLNFYVWFWASFPDVRSFDIFCANSLFADSCRERDKGTSTSADNHGQSSKVPKRQSLDNSTMTTSSAQIQTRLRSMNRRCLKNTSPIWQKKRSIVCSSASRKHNNISYHTSPFIGKADELVYPI